MDQSISVIEAAALCLAEPDPVQKCLAVKDLHANPPPLRDHPRTIAPGRPKRPQLVNPRDLPKRKLGTTVGHGAFVHAICHIEFTAINLALDAVVRFGGMPATYYSDWLGVAAEEAIHYSLLV